MPGCAVLGCDSHSKITPNYTFHRLPRSLRPRARWLLALEHQLDTAYVCSRHFADAMFVERGNTRVLVKNAVPTLFLPPRPKMKQTIKACDDLLACRVCLAVDVQLYTIREIGFEGTFAELTGVPLSAVDGLPQRLCELCRALLSKCADFRDRCKRSHSLLQTLLKRGPLKLNDIKAIDRHSHKLATNLTLTKTYNFQNNPVLEIKPLIKSEDYETLRMVPEAIFTEVEYLEDDDCTGNDTKNENMDISDEKIEIGHRIQKVKLEHDDSEKCFKIENCMDIESKSISNDEGTDSTEEKEEIQEIRKKLKLKDEISNKYLITEDCIDIELKDITDDVGMDSSEEKVEIQNGSKVKLGDRISTKTSDFLIKLRNTENHYSRRRKKVGDEFYPDFDYESFEKEFNLKIKLFTSEEQKQKIENRKTSNKARFCCEICGKGYNHEATMKKHLTIHDTSSGPYECDICHYRFQLNRKMLKHRDTHRLAFVCEICSYVTKNRTDAKAHFLMHEGKTYKCRHCDQVYNLRTSYFNHMRTQHPRMNVACDECGETFLSMRGVLMHKNRGHRSNENAKTEFICSVCDFSFASSAALDRHREEAGDMSHAALWPCAACGDSCGSHAALATHVAERHTPEQLRCEECDSTFASAASFDLHVKRKHLGLRAAAAGASRRLRRPRAAGPQQPVVCEVCGRMVKNESLLRFHLNIHMETKPYACPKCPKRFAAKHALQFHLRVHTGERPYQCEQCPQAFALQSNFVRHCKVVHLNQRKSVSCDLCHKTFTTLSSMQLHVRFVHNNMPWPKRVRKPRKPAPAN